MELNDVSVDGHGVVVVDGSVEAPAEDVTEIHRSRPPYRNLFLRSDAEAFRIAGYEVSVHIVGGCFGSSDTPEPELCDEAVLEGPVDAFTPASGLGRISKDDADPQLAHGPLKLGWLPIVLRYVHTAPTGGGELRGTVKVETRRQAITREDLLTDCKAAIEILLIAKESTERLTRGIIRTEQKRALCGTEPMVRGTIEEQQLTHSGRTLPSLPMAPLSSYLPSES